MAITIPLNRPEIDHKKVELLGPIPQYGAEADGIEERHFVTPE